MQSQKSKQRDKTDQKQNILSENNKNNLIQLIQPENSNDSLKVNDTYKNACTNQNIQRSQFLQKQQYLSSDKQKQKQSQNIWSLFDSLNCRSCQKMYNNKDRKPQIICANNHLLCKACFTKLKQSSHYCIFCALPLNKNAISSQNNSIQNFLKIYNQIYEEKKALLQNKKKRISQLQKFVIPSNLKKIIILLFILVLPWIFEALKSLTDFFISLEKSIIQVIWGQISQFLDFVKEILQDIFYITIYTNQKGQYVYYGDDIINHLLYGVQGQNMKNQYSKQKANYYQSFEDMYTNKHKARIQLWMKLLIFCQFILSKILVIFHVLTYFIYYCIYVIHFICIVIGLIQLPVFLPLILQLIEYKLNSNKLSYRLSIYVDILQSYHSQFQFFDVSTQDIKVLYKVQLYILLAIRNYIESILKFQENMKQKAIDFQERKKQREQMKKRKNLINMAKVNQKDKQKNKMKFTF